MKIHEDFELVTPGTAVAVAWSPDGAALAAASNYGSDISVWDNTGHRISQFKRVGGGPALGGSIAFINGSSHLAFVPPQDAANDIALSIWDIASGKITTSVAGPEPGEDYPLNRASHFTTSPDQKVLALGTTGGKGNKNLRANVMIYNIQDWHILESLKVDEGVTSLCIFANGRFLAVGSAQGYVTVLDAVSGTKLTQFSAYDQSPFGELNIGAIAGSPDGAFLLVAPGLVTISGTYYTAPDRVKALADANSWANSLEPLRLFRVADGQKIASFTLAKLPIRHAVWDPRGRYIAFVDNAGGLFLWQPFGPSAGYRKVELPSASMALDVTSDGGRIAVATERGISVFTVY